MRSWPRAGPAANIHPINTKGLTPDEAARAYEATLKDLYGAQTLSIDRPARYHPARLGSDGHTASLLPGEPILSEYTRWVAPVPHGRPEPRISLTYPRSTAAAW